MRDTEKYGGCPYILYYNGAKEIPTGTCHAILKAAGIKKGGTK